MRPSWLQYLINLGIRKDLHPIARSEIQMGTGNEFLNFNLI